MELSYVLSILEHKKDLREKHAGYSERNKERRKERRLLRYPGENHPG